MMAVTNDRPLSRPRPVPGERQTLALALRCSRRLAGPACANRGGGGPMATARIWRWSPLPMASIWACSF